MTSPSYPNPRTWVDLSGVIGAVDLNRIEDGIELAHVRTDDLVKPYQFRVEDYGAEGNGRMLTDVAISASSTTLTSASAGFTAADVGKHILVNEAGPTKTTLTSGALITTITAVINSTTVTLAAAASRTVSGQDAMYGTDDTAAIRSAIDALGVSANWVGGTYYCELLFDAKIYILATPSDPGAELPLSGPTYGNAQIPLPVLDDYTANKPYLVIKGTADQSSLCYWLQDRPQIGATCLFSMVQITDTASPFGPPSVIGGPNVRTQWDHPNAFNNIGVIIDAIQIMCPYNPGQIAYDFYNINQWAIKTASADVFAGVTGLPTIGGLGGSGLPTNTGGLGLRVNTTGLNDRCDIGSLSIEGYYVGMTVDEHISAQRIAIIYSRIAFYLASEVAGGVNRSAHGCWIGYASLEITDYCIHAGATGGAGSLFSLNIGMLDNEGAVVAHVHDPNNCLTGTIGLMPSASNELPIELVAVGGKNLNITDLGKARGAVTAPSVPATTVALRNPFYRDALVFVTGGTVTVIALDGVATGLTSGMLVVPSGLSVTLTYSSAPTWTWTLM